jgi:hypothetical protein
MQPEVGPETMDMGDRAAHGVADWRIQRTGDDDSDLARQFGRNTLQGLEQDENALARGQFAEQEEQLAFVRYAGREPAFVRRRIRRQADGIRDCRHLACPGVMVSREIGEIGVEGKDGSDCGIAKHQSVKDHLAQFAKSLAQGRRMGVDVLVMHRRTEQDA